MRVQRVLIIAAALAALTPAGAAAQVAGEAQGVTATKGAHGFVLHFSPKAAAGYRKIAGRRVEVGCAEASPPGGFGLTTTSEVTATIRASRRRGPLATESQGHADYCFVRLGYEAVAIVPTGARGRTFLDEIITAAALFVPLFPYDATKTKDPPPADDVVAKGHGLVVGLDGPDASPPTHKVGYWTDGHRYVVAALTKAGRRLFLDVDGDVIRSNALGLLDDPLFSSP